VGTRGEEVTLEKVWQGLKEETKLVEEDTK